MFACTHMPTHTLYMGQLCDTHFCQDPLNYSKLQFLLQHLFYDKMLLIFELKVTFVGRGGGGGVIYWPLYLSLQNKHGRRFFKQTKLENVIVL